MLEAIPLVTPVEMRIDLQDGDGAKPLEPREEWNGNRVIPAEQQRHDARLQNAHGCGCDQRAVLLRCCRIGWKVAKINRPQSFGDQRAALIEIPPQGITRNLLGTYP